MNDPRRSATAEGADLSYTAPPLPPTFVSAVSTMPDSGEMPMVRDVMTTEVRTCRPDHTLVCAAVAMQRGDCRFLPVVDDERRPIAAITDGDIAEIGSSDQRPLRDIFVSEAMSRQLFTCRPDDAIHDVLRTMKENRIRHLPVVDVKGHLAGVISLTDILLCLVEDERHRLASLYPEIAAVLRAVSQKQGVTRVVRFNPFRED